MEEKKAALLKCCLRVFVAYSALSFLWIAFIAMGTNDNSGTTISAFADRLVLSNIAIGFYALIYGFSALIMRAKNLSTPAKYSIHILVNYIAAMVGVYALFSNLRDDPTITTTTWMAVILVATVAFFIIYGIASLVIYLVKKKTK